ncbi:MAG: methyltransferase family protein [Methanosarcina flavescens]|jgi:protein-S-isoprenylcysteine O-methyltransferase Ste14|uniref:Isoprenylcysteine carboxylmethyltransferase family protein n=1 Tax=Methanosarcina flavescens TaxID=1715806 RepID=A0A660HRE2_9EURY|nr:isoprenylcysteine carboxylmethyltransferase family protein [Methanosarcina flavescens]AYK14814.1 isoprenylcysteine carboxylmethyltransferase family protein [Methanosarcina flavescens]NLK33257.1 isoprenylcysteine carboxylmethyltransferase family protein [Methanosarcina flavescens]
MVEFENWKASESKGEWINRAINIVMLLFAAETWKLLVESWGFLNHRLIYIYIGILLFYLLAEKAAYRGSGLEGRQSQRWIRSLLLFFWWLLLIAPILEYIFYLRLKFDFFPQHNITVTAAGASLALIGTGLRVWGMRTLGQYFSVHIEIKNNHQLVEKGPYKFIRHPAYAGNILQAVGVPLILNAYLTLSISAVLVFLFLYRLKREEEVLVREVKGYENYTKRTYRLIPKIW